MSFYKKFLTLAAVAGLSLSAASPASAVTIDFNSLTPGSSISNEYASSGLLISAQTTDGVSSAASITNSGWSYNSLSNAPASSNGDYPTAEFLVWTFTQPVNSLTFNFSNFGDNSGSGGSNYKAYSGALLVDSGDLSLVDGNSLVSVAASNITKLIFDDGFLDSFSSGGGSSWLFGVGQTSFVSSVSAVPLPAGAPMFIGAMLLALAAVQYSKKRTAA